MRIILTFLLSILVVICHATDYWVNQSGSDASPGTQAAPWQTVGKVNGSTVSGDHVHFAGGQAFYGAFVPKSGVSYDSYGSGRATITGFTTVGGWVAAANGIFEAPLAAQPNMVLVNDQFQPIGRWPKLSAANKGYLTFNSHGGSSVTGSLSGAPSFGGGEVVVRNCHWILNRYGVGSQNTSTVTYSGGSNYSRTDDGNGFFFQNHVNACTQSGDWSWSGGKLRIFGQPGTVKAATVYNLVTLASKTDISFTNIIFSGASNHIFAISNSARITLTDCEVDYAGNDGMNTNSGTNHITLLRTNFNWSNNNHIRSNNATDWNIQDCIFTNNGMTAGMGQSGDGSYFATSDLGNNSIVQYNTITNSGYVGINYNGSGASGNNIRILNNLINGFCIVKDDGAAIYTGDVSGYNSHTQCRIENNIILNGVGAGEGAGGAGIYGQTSGIYMDDYSINTIINGNTVSNCGASGIYLHLAKDITVTNNTTFGNKNQELRIVAERSDGLIRNINMSGNIFFNMTAENSQQFFVVVVRSELERISASWGTWNNNYYCRPINSEGQAIIVIQPSPSFVGTLVQWKSTSGKDGNSKITPVSVTDKNKIRFEYNATKAAKVVSLPGTFIDPRGAVYAGSITLAPYTSAVLIQTAVGPPPPTTYQSAARSGSFSRNNCPVGSTGSTVVYTVVAGKYTSTVSQSDADARATADVTTNGQPYANTNGVCTTIPPVTYASASKSGTFTRNDCQVGTLGSLVTYTVAAGKYTSTISQSDADSKAVADVTTNGQAFANANGTCTGTPPPTTYTNATASQTYQRNNCQSGYKGSYSVYSVPAGKYTSTVSQADADAKAMGDLTANGQAYANQNGSCSPASCSFWDKLFRRKGCRF